MALLITICARGGSKGIPGKNIKLLAGKPLIAYTISTANMFKKQFPEADIALSTDSEEIKTVAEEYGLVTSYTRPVVLGRDTTGKIDAIKDLLFFYEKEKKRRYDYILDLDVTSPLRTCNDLNEALKIIRTDPEAVNLFSVNPANRNPYFNMVERKDNGFYGLVKNPDTTIRSRQAAPKVYELNASFYFYKRHFFDSEYNGAITDRSLIYEMPHICFDLDHPVDFEFLSFLIEHNKLGFEL